MVFFFYTKFCAFGLIANGSAIVFICTKFVYKVDHIHDPGWISHSTICNMCVYRGAHDAARHGHIRELMQYFWSQRLNGWSDVAKMKMYDT